MLHAYLCIALAIVSKPLTSPVDILPATPTFHFSFTFTAMDPYQQDGQNGHVPQDHYLNNGQVNGAASGGYDHQMGGSMEVDQNGQTGAMAAQTEYRPRTSQSDGIPASSGAFSPPQDQDRYPSPTMQYQQQPAQNSRPPSSLSNGQYQQQQQQQQQHQQQPQPYQDQRSNQQESKAQSSVVIKVGMVGDAQIGKTSLMVKYVEGSWDEDYIQTLGKDCLFAAVKSWLQIC